MEPRSLTRSNTMSSLNRKATIKRLTFKEHSNKENKPVVLNPFDKHPAAKYLRGTVPAHLDFKKFVTLMHRGLAYSTYNLKGPSDEFILKKQVKLPEPENTKKKFLMLDLDQTLIHSTTEAKSDVQFTRGSDEFKFNVRPYCQEFLSAVSEYFSVYVFTAGTEDYAVPIVNYLNQSKKTIQGVLHRKNCMETHNGFFIKDLRIIQNRSLKDIVIVDNLVHSFGLQLTNGVPILEFTNNKKDRELIGLQNFLVNISEVEDIRDHLKDNLQLQKCLEIHESEFLELQAKPVE